MSWLSKVTGIHISTKGVHIDAPSTSTLKNVAIIGAAAVTGGVVGVAIAGAKTALPSLPAGSPPSSPPALPGSVVAFDTATNADGGPAGAPTNAGPTVLPADVRPELPSSLSPFAIASLAVGVLAVIVVAALFARRGS